MKKIGELLSTEREKKGLSLHEVGMALKINPKILKAIEEADAQGLPAKTFLRGFVRSYAQFLHLDVNHVMKIFQEEMGSTRPEEHRPPVTESMDSSKSASTKLNSDKPLVAQAETLQVSVAKTSSSSSSSPSSSTPTAANTTNAKEKMLAKSGDTTISTSVVYKVVGSIVLVLLIVFVARTVDKYQKESRRIKVDAANPIAVADEKLPPPAGMPNAEGVTEASPMTPISTKPAEDSKALEKPAASPAATPTPPSVNSSGSHAAIAVATPSHATTTIPTSPQVTPKVAPTPSLAPTAVASPTPAATPVATLAKATEVIVEALNNVQIKYTLGDDKWESLSMMGDELHTFKSKANMTLEVSDGGAVNIIVNGRDRGVPGTIGKPIKLSYPK